MNKFDQYRTENMTSGVNSYIKVWEQMKDKNYGYILNNKSYAIYKIFDFIRESKDKFDINLTQLSIKELPEDSRAILRGYAITFPERISIAECLDLAHITIYDEDFTLRLHDYLMHSNASITGATWFDIYREILEEN